MDALPIGGPSTGSAAVMQPYRIEAGPIAALAERAAANDQRLQYASPAGFPADATAHIRPRRKAMTSGNAGAGEWLLRFEPRTPQVVEPLMGWCSGSDPLQHVELRFPSKEKAVAYARRQGLAFSVSNANEAKRPTRTYADNFPMFDPAHAIFDHPAAIEVDMAKALSDPAPVFASPRDGLEHAALSRRAKLDILRRWAWIAGPTDSAEIGAVPDGSEPSRLAEVLEALAALGEMATATPTTPANDAIVEAARANTAA
jgi:hypothetical protein